MGEQQNPAGLGSKLYVCRAEDFEKDPNTPMKEIDLAPHVGDIAMYADAQEGEDGWGSKGGFSLTATLDATPEQQKLIRRLTQGQGRLPRRRKKQVMNRVLRHGNRICGIIALLTHPMFGEGDALNLTTQVMFHDRVRGYSIVINEAEYHTAVLCLKRIEKKYRKHIEALKNAV